MCYGAVVQNAIYGDITYEHDSAVYSKYRNAPEFDVDISPESPFGA
jgi:hypothetical protein